MKILCLPDFVGHPICYSAFASGIKKQSTPKVINYSDLWPYESLETLACKITNTIDLDRYDLLVGYSFGAHVATLCASRSKVARLCLIDPPPLASLRGLTLDNIRQRLAADPRYAYVQDLVAAELVDPDCVHGNILLLSRLAHLPPVDAPTDLLLCASSAVEAVKADYPGGRYWRDDERDHATIVASHTLIQICLPDAAPHSGRHPNPCE
ncbi:alpha/beta fold hydrolase [Pseudomonas sp. 15FMM2]|uniref:Alpha/beta fold hydrolase n=1 Tax=Pseudomonas imrae TaxID=2992837 RepID=A0ACC7PRV9_9PSED